MRIRHVWSWIIRSNHLQTMKVNYYPVFYEHWEDTTGCPQCGSELDVTIERIRCDECSDDISLHYPCYIHMQLVFEKWRLSGTLAVVGNVRTVRLRYTFMNWITEGTINTHGQFGVTTVIMLRFRRRVREQSIRDSLISDNDPDQTLRKGIRTFPAKVSELWEWAVVHRGIRTWTFGTLGTDYREVWRMLFLRQENLRYRRCVHSVFDRRMIEFTAYIPASKANQFTPRNCASCGDGRFYIQDTRPLRNQPQTDDKVWLMESCTDCSTTNHTRWLTHVPKFRFGVEKWDWKSKIRSNGVTSVPSVKVPMLW